LTKAIELDPTNVLIRGDRAWVYLEYGKYDLARDDCDETLRMDPKNFWAWVRRSWANRLGGDLDQAVLDAQRAIEIGHTKVDHAYEQLAEAYWALGDYPFAAKPFRRLIELRPQQVSVWSRYCVASIAAGDLDAYRQFCQELVDKHRSTDQRPVQTAIARCVTAGPDAVQDWPPVLELCEPIREQNPAQYAALLARAGQYQTAIDLRKGVLAQQDKEPEVWGCLWLSTMEHGLGNSAAAIKWFEQCELKLNESPDVLNDCRFQNFYKEFSALIGREPTRIRP
jgi:tetratricopeptide (TPR) repeat protein